MAHNVSVFGLSRAGFRIPDVVSTPGFVKLVNGVTAKINVDAEKTQNLIYSEKDNFIRTVDKQTFTVTVATPGVFTANGHSLVNGDIVKFTTTGALPTGLVAGTKYYVIASTTNTFEVSATYGGSAINTTGSQSGTHTLQQVSASIVGLSPRGFRIKNSAGTIVMVKLGNTNPTQVDLTDYKILRNLRRNKELWFVSKSATSITVRGLVSEQRGFDLIAKEAITLTGSNGANATNAKTVTIGSQTYTIKTNLTEVKATDTITTSGTPASVRATGTITTSSTGAANNDTVSVGGVTYTFKTSLTGAANEILRDGVEDHDLTNLISAINLTSGSGSTYGTGTVINPLVTAGTITSHVLTLTAKSYLATNGNAVALAKTGVVLTVSGALFTGGTNESVTLNSQAYTFVEALDSGVAYEVLINGQDTSLTNLAAAINGSAGAGTTYGTGTVGSTQFASSSVTSHVITLTALAPGTAGNAFTATKSGAHLAVGGANFSGGINPVLNEVHIGGSADATLTNLSEAINAGSNAGTDYSTGTTANVDATASAVASHVVTLTETHPGAIPLVTTTNETTYTFSGETGGIAKVYQGSSATIDPSLPQNYRQLRRHYKSWIES